MAGEWQTLPFSEAISINPKVPLTRETNYPFVDMAAVNSNSRCAYMSEEREFKGGGSRFQAGDTLLARITPCLENGKIARFCAPGGTVAHGSTEFIVIRGREGVSSTAYAYYLTKWENVRGYAISQMTGTSGRQRVPTASLDHLDVPLPPLPEQHKIADILGSLDDKIELNRRMNRTLEAMARAIFRSWFVDFEPVKAKAAGAGGFRGMPQAIFDQLPERFTDTELGPVPEGWEIKPLDEIADFLNGLALQKYPASDPDDSLPVIKIAELRNGISEKSGRASREIPEKYIVKDGDFLFSWSGSLLAKFWTQGEGALNQHLFKVTSHKYPMWFVTQWVYEHICHFRAIAESKATTMGHIQRKHLKEALTVCVTDNLLSQMDGVISPIVEQAIVLELESRTLAAIRDTLLPKLISGEVRVPVDEGVADGE